MLLNASFIAFETLNCANSSASSALGSISLLNGSLCHETCNASSLKYDQNSAETISRCSMLQVFVLSSKSILFIFRCQQRKRCNGPYLDSCLPDSHSSSWPGQLVFNVVDCHITALQRQVYVVDETKYIGQTGTQASQQTSSLRNWIWRLFLFSRRSILNSFLSSYNRERSLRGMDFGKKQNFHMLRSHFFGQKPEESVIFCPGTNEVDHVDRNVHHFHQM